VYERQVFFVLLLLLIIIITLLLLLLGCWQQQLLLIGPVAAAAELPHCPVKQHTQRELLQPMVVGPLRCTQDKLRCLNTQQCGCALNWQHLLLLRLMRLLWVLLLLPLQACMHLLQQLLQFLQVWLLLPEGPRRAVAAVCCHELQCCCRGGALPVLLAGRAGQ
jgi:hypothetical protein